MGLSVADTYYLKAKGALNGPYGEDWEQAVEALNYALSYDSDHVASLCFLGDIYASYFQNFEKAFSCFDRVIGINSQHLEVYPMYIKYATWADQTDRALKLLAFAKDLKGANRSELFWLKATILESQRKYNKALKTLEKARYETCSDSFFYFLEDETKRIKKKQRLKEGKQEVVKKDKEKESTEKPKEEVSSTSK